MTPEERFERIETNLERLTERMNAFEAKRETDMADWRTRHDALEVERSTDQPGWRRLLLADCWKVRAS